MKKKKNEKRTKARTEKLKKRASSTGKRKNEAARARKEEQRIPTGCFLTAEVQWMIEVVKRQQPAKPNCCSAEPVDLVTEPCCPCPTSLEDVERE